MLKGSGALALGSGSLIGRSQAQTGGIPTNPVEYQIRMVGQTPYGQFDRTGLIYISPSLEMTPSNPRDIALVSGNPKGAPEIGAMEFYTNTYMLKVLNRGGSPGLVDGRIKIGTVQIDESSGLLQAQPRYDQGFNPIGVPVGLQVNIFTPQAGIVAPLYEMTDGRLDIQFRDGNQISGAMEFTGISLGGAANQSQVVAEFIGTAV